MDVIEIINHTKIVNKLSNVEQRASILLLNVDCFEVIFDFLSLKDLCSVGQTCIDLHRIAGEYFGRVYSSQSVYFCRTKNGDIIEKVDGLDTNFALYTQHLDFFNGNFGFFRYAAINANQKLKSIQFDVKKCSPAHSKCIKNLLKTVENVTFFRCFENGQSFHHILRYCLNLRCLTVYNWPITKYEWPTRKYSTLECLELFGKFDVFCERCESLMRFLQQNQQIKKISTSIEFTQVLRIIENADLKLDELGFVLNGIDKMIVKVLRECVNKMHGNGYFKELKMFCYWGNYLVYYIDDVRNLQGLTTVEIGYIDHYYCDMNQVIMALVTLVNLKELRFFYCSITIDQAILLSEHLINLKKLHLGCNSFDVTIPFIRSLPQLKIIEVGESGFSMNINIRKLNSERGSLSDAVKLTIHLPEGMFLVIKWTLKRVNYDWIQFKRDNHIYPIR